MADLLSSEVATVTGAVVGSGGIAAWIRERRKGRKDANTFALEFMQTQTGRIDQLVGEVAELKADNRVAEKALRVAEETIHQLRNQLTVKAGELLLAEREIERLKTALQHPHPHGGQS